MIFRCNRFSLFFPLSSVLALLLAFSNIPAWADDLTNPEGTTIAVSWDGSNGNDTMTNHGTIDSNINAMDGNDTIINFGTVAAGMNGQNGNDTIINYGTTNDIVAYNGNDTITNYGTVTDTIIGQAGDDTITNCGTAVGIVGGPGTDSLTMEAGSYVDNHINGFEFITIKGNTTVGNLNLADLDTMTVTMTSVTAPVSATTVANAAGTLSVEITDGSFITGQAVNIFSTGAVATFGVETVTDSSPVLSFTINNAQVTASRDTTFNALVAGAADGNVSVIAGMFEDKAETATGNLADVIGKMNFMTQTELESAFRQMASLEGGSQAMAQGLRMGSGAAMARMDSMLATRSAAPRTGFSPLSAISRDNDNQSRSLENLHFMQTVLAMIADDGDSLFDTSNAMGLAGSENFAAGFAFQDVALPAVEKLGPSLNLGTSKAGGAWLRALGGRSHQDDDETTYGYDGETYGLAGGMDDMFFTDTLAGIFGSWTRLHMEYDDPGTSKADGNVFQLGLYSAWGPDAWFVETALSATYGAWDSRRRILSGGIDETATSDQNVYGMNLALTTGRDCAAGSFVITPVAGFEYNMSHRAKYTERRAGALNQTVSSATWHSLRPMAGFKLERPFLLEGATHPRTLAPAIKAQWLHEFLGEEELDASYADIGTVTTKSPDPKRGTARLGASLTLTQEDQSAGYISYETNITENYMDHTIAAGFKMPF